MTKNRPVIGIPAAIGRPSPTGYINQQVGAPYVRAVELAGGLPLLLPVIREPDLEQGLLDRVDGLLFQGGGDIAPSLYGQEARPEVPEWNEVTDRFELDLCRQAIERELPVLAICRGIQVLNVALGGTLIQDLPTQAPQASRHRQAEPRHEATHEVLVDPSSKLARVLGETSLKVNSFHHQALEQLGSGLVVSARTPDQVIEAVERPDREYAIGVQFHPEETVDSVPATRRLFDELVNTARDTARRRCA